jgi:2,3-dihydroxy-p-cumate/2,3-dihydroxybenzoate 3,4-dioxygenase
MTIPFRYKRLGYVALNVTDIAKSTAFYRDLVGLDVSESASDFTALRCGRDHHNMLLYPASEPGLKRIAFELESRADIDAARRHLQNLSIAVTEVSAEERAQLQLDAALRFRVPDCGICLEFFFGILPAASPYQATLAKIERLGHVVVNVRHFDRVLNFVTQQLGFRVSDQVPGFAAFLRCFPNPLHHSLAILNGADDHLNHVNFMVTDIDDIGRAMNRMKRNNVDIVFGPGRHQPSESIFLYFLDPDRMTVEYSFGMETFAELSAREPRVLEARPEVLDLWGSVPTPNFGKVGVIEQTDKVAA